MCIVPKLPACRASLCSLCLCNVAISRSSFWQACCFPLYKQSFTPFWQNLQLPSGLFGIRSRVCVSTIAATATVAYLRLVRNTGSIPSNVISCGEASRKSFSMTHGFHCSRPKAGLKRAWLSMSKFRLSPRSMFRLDTRGSMHRLSARYSKAGERALC